MSHEMILRIPQAIHLAIIEHARAELPNECVGMLVGSKEGMVRERYALVNELRSEKRFLSEPYSMLRAEKQRRAGGYEVLAIYHSHPSSPPLPSRYDIADHLSPEVMCIIVSLASEEPEVKGWWIEEGKVCEGTVQVQVASPSLTLK